MPKSTAEAMIERAVFEAPEDSPYSIQPPGARSAMKAAMGTYAACTFESYIVGNNRNRHAALEACREYASSWPERFKEGNGLVLYGTIGTGKDHLAAATVSAIMQSDPNCWGVWLWCRQAFESLRADLERESDTMNRLRKAPLLVLSDPLPVSGGITPWQADVLNRIADHRCNHALPTILTLNVTGEKDGQSQLGAATWDRLAHRAWMIEAKWPSKRGPARRINIGDT